MKSICNIISRVSCGAILIFTAACLTSCDDKTYDHTPPAGQGSILVDNSSGVDAHVYVDGTLLGTAESGRVSIFDIAPGQYRIVLAEVDGYRNYRDYVDVLQDRLTILDVAIDYTSATLFYVLVDFQ